jgi:hypothetical protein
VFGLGKEFGINIIILNIIVFVHYFEADYLLLRL